jgi:hypothetical protein
VKAGRPAAAALLLALVAAALPVRGEDGFGLATEDLSEAPRRFHLEGVELRAPGPLGPVPAAPASAEAAPRLRPPPKLWDGKTLRLTAGVILGLPVVGLSTWWRNSVHTGWHFGNERWFQEDTYAGGADKASHIFFGYLGTEALRAAYKSIGKTDSQARLLSVGVTTLGGAVVEFGDGFSAFGFSWEDLASDVIGAVVSDQIHAHGLEDTLGLRIGVVKALTPEPCCSYKDGVGDDYSKEIYSFDVKLAGLLPRMKVRPGPARFLSLSFTYGTKGYRYSLPEYRERSVGFDIGLNVPEILRAVGVRDESWWGGPLLALLTYFRIPYTALGWRYDMNQGVWRGPDTGDAFFPGP